MDKLTSTGAVVLGLLELGPPPGARDAWDGTMTGASVWDTAERSVGGFWSMTRSQVYQELKRLTEAGLARTTAGGGFRITAKGKAAARAWFEEMALSEPRDDQLRSPLVLLVFFGHLLPNELLARVVREHRLRYERRLDVLRVIERALDGDTSLPAATLTWGIGYLDAITTWTDDVLRRVDGQSAGRMSKRAMRPSRNA